MKYYKLTDHEGRTYGGTQWGNGVHHAATGSTRILCTSGLIHGHRSRYLAVLMNPVQANFVKPQCWEFMPEGEEVTDRLQSGWPAGTTLKRVPLARFSLKQRVYFAILCAQVSFQDLTWNKWANDWINNTDRSPEAAVRARAAVRVAWGARAYDEAFAWAARAAWAGAGAWAARAAEVAGAAFAGAGAARAALSAEEARIAWAGNKADFVALAYRAYCWKG